MGQKSRKSPEERLQRVIEAQPNAMLMVNQQGDVVLVNTEAEKLFGRPRDEMIGHSIEALLPDGSEVQNRSNHRSSDRFRPILQKELSIRRKGDSELPVEVGQYPIETSKGPAILYSMIDISARKRAESALHESEARFRNMADTAPVMIWSSGADKLCNFFNKGWLDFTGRSVEQELGDGWAKGVHPDDLDKCLTTYSASFDARKSFRMEYRLRRADGQYRWVQDNGVPLFAPDGIFTGYIGSCIDITDSKRALREALSRQKLESLAVVVTGIAHDFGNLLNGVIAHAELILDDLPGASPLVTDVKTIVEIAVRGSEIVKELMVYTGQDGSNFVPLDISAVVEEMLELLKVSISKNAILRTHFDRNLPAVLASATHIRQILMNLVINASEAIGSGSGVIEVTTSMAIMDDGPDSEAFANLPAGNYVRLVVSDTGVGMRPDVQAKIFDPFFTTKPEGRGLGLAVIQGIVRRYGGAITVKSAPGQGARFEIVLPPASQLNPHSRTAKSGH